MSTELYKIFFKRRHHQPFPGFAIPTQMAEKLPVTTERIQSTQQAYVRPILPFSPIKAMMHKCYMSSFSIIRHNSADSVPTYFDDQFTRGMPNGFSIRLLHRHKPDDFLYCSSLFSVLSTRCSKRIGKVYVLRCHIVLLHRIKSEMYHVCKSIERLIAKRWPRGFAISKVRPQSCNKYEKKKTRLRFSLKFVHSKLPVHGHDPDFSFLHRYSIVSSTYNKNTPKWSFTAQM